jgi:hypothetical protein
VIWRDHGVELTAHRAHEDGIRRERPINSGGARGRLEKLRVFAAESPTVAGMRIESA